MSRLNEKSILFTENTLTFPVLKNRLFLNRVSISLDHLRISCRQKGKWIRYLERMDIR